MESEDEAAVDSPDDSTHGHDSEKTCHTSKQDARFRHKSDVYIAEGVYTDCENILKQFLAKQTSTFEDFATIWQEKKFSLIYSGRDSYSELLEFSEEALTIAKSFILPPHSQIKRIGALYLMYGLYTQQPYQDIAKFRVTPQEWSVILKFVESLKAHGFIDANYIFHKMCLDGAFMTVAFTREYGLERNYRKYLTTWQARDKELEPGVTFSLENLMGRVYRGSLKSAADKLRTKYNNIKKILADKQDTKFQSLNGTEKELEQVMVDNILCTTDGFSQDLGEAKKFSDLGGGRRSIINKAFSLKSKQRGSHRTLLDTLDASEPSTSQANSEKTANSTDLNVELESDSEGFDLEHILHPPSLRNSKKLKSRTLSQGKSQDQEKLPSTGHKRKGPRSYDFAYEEVTGMKTKYHRRSTVSSSEVVKEIDSCQSAESVLTIKLDDVAPPPGMPESAEIAKFKSPTSVKGRRKGKQNSSVTVQPSDKGDECSTVAGTLPSLSAISTPVKIKNKGIEKLSTEKDLINNKAESSSTVKNSHSSVDDISTPPQTKKRGGKKAQVKNDLTSTMSPKKSCLKVEVPGNKGKKSTRRSKSALDITESCSTSETPEVSPTKSTRRSAKSCALNINDSCSSPEIPEVTPTKSTRRSAKSSASNINVPCPSSETL
ncbi:uncharacterized protein LOC117641714 [Thrips palmi]|uniref:Uncharacterized protein LOC117641714 n=1 Tax=Thrips palmi TaxID=161013 RepID=A0A6P8YFB1_THRPL|nr:uncharacterized protein LOC117641714 [Thrips palmi]